MTPIEPRAGQVWVAEDRKHNGTALVKLIRLSTVPSRDGEKQWKAIGLSGRVTGQRGNVPLSYLLAPAPPPPED